MRRGFPRKGGFSGVPLSQPTGRLYGIVAGDFGWSGGLIYYGRLRVPGGRDASPRVCETAPCVAVLDFFPFVVDRSMNDV